MAEWRNFEREAAEFLRRQGYSAKLNDKVTKNPGISFEKDRTVLKAVIIKTSRFSKI